MTGTAHIWVPCPRTFLLLAVAADVGVVAVQRAGGHMRPAAVVLSVQRVDGDVDQMEHHLFTHVHISVRILKHSEYDAETEEDHSYLLGKNTNENTTFLLC